MHAVEDMTFGNVFFANFCTCKILPGLWQLCWKAAALCPAHGNTGVEFAKRTPVQLSGKQQGDLIRRKRFGKIQQLDQHSFYLVTYLD